MTGGLRARVATPSKVLRASNGDGARVRSAELFFDLIYAFAVTQLSHHLLGDLSLSGALHTLLLWFAVWLGWQYTCWVTNWFDPDALPIRLMLFAVMLVGLVMAAALPEAFGKRGLMFAACYAGLQVGRTLFVLYHLGGAHALTRNFQRILGWTSISAVFWIAGGVNEGGTRVVLWTLAVACEYISPMFGFRLPGLGRSHTEDWTIEGGHLAERCQLFVIVALGESILVTGATVTQAQVWDAPILIALIVAFIGSVAMWWMYFDTSSARASHVIEHASDPGRLGAYFHYIHVVLIAGIIVSAVADDLAIAHPDGHAAGKYVIVLVGGPALYILGNAVFKHVVYGRLPLSHLAGLVGLMLIAVFAGLTDLLMVSGLTSLLLTGVAIWEACSRRKIESA